MLDSTELILNTAVAKPNLLENATDSPLLAKLGKAGPGIDEISQFSDEKKKRVAKDFESVLINKLMDSMKSTTGQFDIEDDGASEQIEGIFWMYLGCHIADNGGFGLWKDIYKFMVSAEQKSDSAKIIDKGI